jgi:amino acid permease
MNYNDFTTSAEEKLPVSGTIDGSDLDYLDDDIKDIPSNEGTMKKMFGKIGPGSLRGSAASFASICFGVGSLSFPYGIDNMGLIPALFMMASVIALTYWSLSLVIKVGRQQRNMDYSDMVQNILGKGHLLATDINNLILCFGAMMAFIFTISKFFGEVTGAFYGYKTIWEQIPYWWKIVQMLVFMVLFQIPLGLLRNISKLQYVSLVGLCGLLYTTLLILVEMPFYIQEAQSQGRSLNLAKPVSLKYLDSFSIFFYAFASHNGLGSIFKELKRPSLRRSMKVLNYALGLQCFVFCLIAFGGFFSMIEDLSGTFISRKTLDIITNSWGQDYFIIVSKILFIISLHSSLAVNYNIIRPSWRNFFNKGQNLPFKWELIIAVISYSVSNLIVYFVDDVVQILGVVGGICAIHICYFNPVMCWMKTNTYPRNHWKNVTSAVILVIVCVIGVAATILAFYNFIQAKIDQANK